MRWVLGRILIVAILALCMLGGVLGALGLDGLLGLIAVCLLVCGVACLMLLLDYTVKRGRHRR